MMKLDIEEYTKEEPVKCRRCGLDATYQVTISSTEIDKTCCACGYTESWLLRRRGRGYWRYDNHYAPAGVMVHVKTKDKVFVTTRLESAEAIREAEKRIRKEVRDGRVDGATVCIRMWDSEEKKVRTVLCSHTLELEEVRSGLQLLATATGLFSDDKRGLTSKRNRSGSR
jgi:hypothetical protein